jgi:hypothetical protein
MMAIFFILYISLFVVFYIEWVGSGSKKITTGPDWNCQIIAVIFFLNEKLQFTDVQATVEAFSPQIRTSTFFDVWG